VSLTIGGGPGRRKAVSHWLTYPVAASSGSPTWRRSRWALAVLLRLDAVVGGGQPTTPGPSLPAGPPGPPHLPGGERPPNLRA